MLHLCEMCNLTRDWVKNLLAEKWQEINNSSAGLQAYIIVWNVLVVTAEKSQLYV